MEHSDGPARKLFAEIFQENGSEYIVVHDGTGHEHDRWGPTYPPTMSRLLQERLIKTWQAKGFEVIKVE